MANPEHTRARLVLASGSRRRKQLLEEAGIQFEIVESAIVEKRYEGEDAPAFALRMARAKALAVSARIADALVIGADTVVEIDREILGKPLNIDDARRMLEKLAGRTHIVITAFALARHDQILESAAVVSRVTFRRVEPAEIESYLAGNEPYDKAGAYAVQGSAADFIARIDGSYTNVMGLPMEETLAALRRHHKLV